MNTNSRFAKTEAISDMRALDKSTNPQVILKAAAFLY
jgi:hypothetical protein